MSNSTIGKKIKLFENKINEYLEKNNELPHNPLECYIMNKDYEKVLSKHSSQGFFAQEINQYFIDNFNDAIKYLETGDYFKYTNKEIMESFQNENDLNKLHHISYVYIFKKKIIIDFNENDEHVQSILIIPANQILNDEKIFIISDDKKNNNKEKLFQSLLNEDINELSDIKKIKDKYKEYLEEFDDYLNNVVYKKGECECGCGNIFHDENKIKRIKQQIEILILIYYYEKLIENNDMPDSIQYNYYLIKSEWIEKYKSYYYYNRLTKLLDKEKNNSNINFNIIDNYKKLLTEKFLKEYIKILPQNVLLNYCFKSRRDIQAKLEETKNLNYYNNCYIIPGKIFDVITKLEFNKNPSAMKIYTKEIISYNGNILINIYSTNIDATNIILYNSITF